MRDQAQVASQAEALSHCGPALTAEDSLMQNVNKVTMNIIIIHLFCKMP